MKRLSVYQQGKSKKIKYSSRIRRFTRREAIQLKAKFALANLMRSIINSPHII